MTDFFFFLTYRHTDCICSFGLAAERLRTKPVGLCKDYVIPHTGFTEKEVEPSDLEGQVQVSNTGSASLAL